MPPDRAAKTLEERTVRFNKSDLVLDDRIIHLNLPDLNETAVYTYPGSDEYLLIECDPADRPTVCPNCKKSGYLVSNGYTQFPRLVHDVNIGLTQVDLLVRVPKYRCNNCGATPNHEFRSLEYNRQFTKRLLDQIKVEAFCGSFEDVAAKFGISPTNVGLIFDDYAKELEAQRGPIEVGWWLAIDEKHIDHKMRGVFVDGATGRLLEMTLDNRPDTVKRTIMGFKNYENVKVVTMDMANSYRGAIESVFGSGAIVVVDKWHVLSDLSQKITKCRTAIIAYLNDQIPREPDPVVAAKKREVKKLVTDNGYLFRFGEEKLLEKPLRLQILAEACKTFPEFNHLRLLKERFESIYDCPTKEDALVRFTEWCDLVPPSGKNQIAQWEEAYGVPAELYKEMRTLRNAVQNIWHREIFNYFSLDAKVTNAIAEAMNSFIQRFSSEGYSFPRLRAKCLFWHQAGSRCRYVLERKQIQNPDSGSSGGSQLSPRSIGYVGLGRFHFGHDLIDVYSVEAQEVPTHHKPVSILCYLSPEAIRAYNDHILKLRYGKNMICDFGFKLAVINSLLDKETSFGSTLQELKKKYEDSYEWGTYTCIPEILKYLKELVLTDEDLAQVKTLVFSGANEIYFYLMPDWDGESSEFDIHSVEDAALLPNLEYVEYEAMCDPSLLDGLEAKGIKVY